MALIRGLNHKIVSSGTGLVNSKLISNTHYPNYSKAVEIQLFASGETLSVPKGTIDPDLIKILKSYGVSINTRDTFNKLSQLSNRDLKQLSDEILFLSALNVTRFGGASNEHQIYSWILSTETLVKFYEHEYFLLKNGKNDSDKRLHAFLEYLDKAYFHDESTNTPAYFANLAGGFFCQILTLELVGKDPKNLKTNRTKKAFLTALSYAATTILLYDELGLTSEKIISSLYQSKIKQSGPVYNFLKAATPSMSPFCTWFDVKDHRTKLKTAFESIRSRIKGAKLTADLKSKYEAHLTVLETLQEI
jgi:hypothetical protein